MTNQERIDNLIIKVINLTLELREMKEDIKAIETKVETETNTEVYNCNCKCVCKNPILKNLTLLKTISINKI